MKKRFLSVLLSLCLCLTLLPTAALADTSALPPTAPTAIEQADIDQGFTLTEGSYRLGGDITLAGSPLTVTGTVTLDLNGHTLTGANGSKEDFGICGNGGAAITVEEGGSLTITGSGSIVGGNGCGADDSAGSHGGNGGTAITVEAGGSLTVSGGTIKGGNGGIGSNFGGNGGGGGAAIAVNSGSLTVSGGSIVGGNGNGRDSGVVEGNGGSGGSGIEITGGIVNIDGSGTINGGNGSNGSASTSRGGSGGAGGNGLLVTDGTVTITGSGTINGGNAGNGGCGSYGDGGFGGNGGNGLRIEGGAVSVGGSGTINGGTAGTGGSDTTGSTSGDNGTPGKAISLSGTDLSIGVSSADMLKQALECGATSIQLTGDITLSETLNVTKNLTLDLNGHVLKMAEGSSGSVIKVTSGGNLTLKDSNKTKPHYFTVDSDTGLWTLTDTVTENVVKGGIITGGTGTAQALYACGGGVYVDKNGIFNMSGGSIVGCTATSSNGGYGGGVYVNGSFTMSGDAKIDNCKANHGGGVYINGTGSLEMSGSATIRNCTATYGGGVYIDLNASDPATMSGGSLTMSGGSISGTATNAAGEGGSVHIYNYCSFTISGGTVNGAVKIHSGSTLNANGGTISGDVVNWGTITRTTAGGINTYTAFNGTVTNWGGGKIEDAAKLTVTFDLNGGDETAPDAQKVLKGQTVNEPAQAPTRTGDYVFGGWYTDTTDYTKQWTFATDKVTDNITLYARWLKKIQSLDITVYIDGVAQADEANAKATYNGAPHTVSFVIKDGDYELQEGTDYTLTTDSTITATDVGNYEFGISGKGNYAGGLNSWTGGWQIVVASVTGGSSAPTYSVTAPTAANGTVTVSPKNAKKGTTVTVTVAPDKGYTLETLTVTDKDGNAIELTDLGGGKYSFKMPAGKVTVNATFMEDNTMLNFFVDVPADAYYHDAVLWAAKNGITGGMDENHFGPGLSCTRAQLVTFLWRAAGCPVVNNPMDFTDVGDSYYTEAVRWAASLGIVGGYGNGLFGTGDTITRQQFVTILYRFAVAMGCDVSVGEDTNILSYNDAFDVAEYAVSAFQWATGAGIVQGNDGNLMPGQPCTRAQIVTMLYRLLGE